MDKRLELHEKLCEILGTRNVYFQPPESIQMKYPAIVYSLNDITHLYANGRAYLSLRKYSVILIDWDPDSSFIEKLLNVQHCRFIRPYISDNLNHFVFELYY